MQWSEIWENFKQGLGTLITKDNYILVLYFSLIFFILIFTIYPFMNLKNINEIMKIYQYILVGIILILFILFLYLSRYLNIGNNFYSIVVGIETFGVVLALIALTYHIQENVQSFSTMWSVLNIGIILGFTIYFFYSFWKCYKETENYNKTKMTCDANLFYSWWIWAIVIFIFFGFSLFFTSTGLYDWNVFTKQTTIYGILLLFVFTILLDNNSITGGKLSKKSQLVTPNSILQMMLKFFCIICIFIFTQVFLNYTKPETEKGVNYSFIPIIIIIINIIPFIFNNLQSWIQKLILYPFLFLLFFGSIFFIVGGFNIFKVGYNILNKLFSWNVEKFDISISTFGILFHSIIFIFVYGFTIFLLFVYSNYANEANKNEDTKGTGYDNFKKWYSTNWWLWIGFVFCYLALSGVSSFADYFFRLFGDNIQISNLEDFIKIGEIPITLKSVEGFFQIAAILLTCGYLFLLYYDVFNKKTDWSSLLNGETNTQLYINTISVILIICILLFSLSKYTKISSSIIVIFILLAILFIYNKVYDFLYSDLWKHASRNNCNNLQNGGVGFGFLFLFLSLIVAFWLSGKKTNPVYLFIAFLISIFGYYFGETISTLSTDKNRYNQDTSYCSDFTETPPLTTNDSIKIIVYISIVILLFIGMNFFTQKLTNMGGFEILIIGVLFYLFLNYIIIVIKSLVNIVDILYILINKKYYTSSIPNRWADFLVSFTTILVFMSSIGLLITACSNKLISGFLNFNVKSFDWFSEATFSSFIYGLSNEFISFQENPISKTILLFLLLIYKFFQMIAILPEKLNSIYFNIGNFIEKNFLKSAVMILVIEISIICLYLLATKTYKSVNSSFIEKIQLIKMPTVIFPSKTISFPTEINPSIPSIPSIPFKRNYEELPKEQPYTFGLSFSLFIEETGSLNYFIPILSYNNNPCIMYKPSANNLVVTIPKGYANVTPEKKRNSETSEIINSYTVLNSKIGSVIDDKYIVYSTTDVKLQTWMNIFINYNNGVIDIFVNGQLGNSSNINQIMPDEYSNTITFGFENVEDTHIKINNLNFYNKDIGVDNILRINLKNYTE